MMDPYYIIAIVSLVLLLIVLVIGGLLVRTDLYRRMAEKRGVHYPRSRILEDLRPVQNVMVEFVAESEPSRDLLQYVRKYQPVSIRALLQEYRFQDNKEDRSVPVEKLFTAVFILGVSGLVRFGAGGMSLTDAGREVLTRIDAGIVQEQTFDGNLLPNDLMDGAPRSAAASLPHQTQDVSHMHLVKNALEQTNSVPLPDRVLSTRGFRLGQLRAVSNDGAATPSIIISASDHHELTAALVAMKKLAVLPVETQKLQEKLAAARIVASSELPGDVITMGSRAELLDLETKERVIFTLVFPIHANLAAGRVSVLEPLGRAMLGRRLGDQFEWPIPYGLRQLEVTAVHFQPEAAIAVAA